MVAVKIPSGSSPLPTPVMTGTGGTIVTTALAEPLGPVAVTVALPEPGQLAGAVYSPLVLTVPAVAVQPVAPADVNCCVAFRFSVAAVGEIVCGVPFTRVTVAEAEPLGPVAVTVAVFGVRIVAGAVQSPLVLRLPAVAVQFVAPVDVNCCAAPRFNVTVTGEMV